MSAIKAVYEDSALIMKQVYYESEATVDAVQKLEFDSKNFAQYRPIED